MTNKSMQNLNIITDKYKPLIIYNLFDGRKKFTHLQKLTSGISNKVLLENLKELETNNLVNKKYFYEYPPRVEYSLTSKGYEYARLLKEFGKLG